jgi:threonine synthase
MMEQGRIAPDELVVCLVSGNGLKDIANAQLAVRSLQVIDPTLDAVASALIR